MTRSNAITLAIALMLAAPLVALTTTGCTATYERSDVGVDSADGKAVAKMIADLRAAGPAQVGDFIAAHGAGELTADQSTGLKAMLTQIAKSPSAQLVSFDRFGSSVYRAGIKLGDARSVQNLFVLLVRSGGELRWAGTT